MKVTKTERKLVQFTSCLNRVMFVVVRFIGETISNRYGPGTGPILLDDLECDGSERFIGNCSHNGWGTHNCGHDEDVSITCISMSLTTTTAPLPPSRHGATRFLRCFVLCLHRDYVTCQMRRIYVAWKIFQ